MLHKQKLKRSFKAKKHGLQKTLNLNQLVKHLIFTSLQVMFGIGNTIGAGVFALMGCGA